MTEPLDWNAKTHRGVPSQRGPGRRTLPGRSIVLVHHRGRKSEQERVTPVMYSPTRPTQTSSTSSRPGPEHRSTRTGTTTWSLAGAGRVERGTEAYDVTVRELPGDDRDRVYAEQARATPGFAEYERQTAGVRTIPVPRTQ